VRSAVTRRYRLRRAIERGDPRFGLIVGVLISLLCAVAFVRRDLVGVAETLELKTLDFSFRQRAPIRESDRILLVDIDDRTLRELPWPLPRESYGQAISALDRLGARQIVFDVQFKTTIPRPKSFDEETGQYLLTEGDRALRSAIARSGKVVLAYSFDVENPLPSAIREAFPAIKEAFLKKPGADLEEASRLSGVAMPLLRDELEKVREQALVALVAERMDRQPKATFLDLRHALLPDYDPQVHARELKLLQYAYWMWRCERAIEAKSNVLKVDASPFRSHPTQGILPPLYPFLEPASGVGCVNAQSDADGVMRRPSTYIAHQGRMFPYLGLEAALRDLAGESGGNPATLHTDSVHLSRGNGETVLPVDPEGRLLVNWAGNRSKRRDQCFDHLPFAVLLEFHQKRYEIMDRKYRDMILNIAEDERQPLHKKYLALGDQLNPALQGRLDLPSDECRAIESKMDEIRGRMIADIDSDLVELDKGIAKLAGKQQLAKRLAEQRANLAAQREQLLSAEGMEKALRARVEGRICFVGSASTASGDLHATPLAGSTPGVDVLANVANMALTGQVIRRAPGWVNFMYLFGMGLLVAFYVTHWNATWSAVATAATIAASGGLFWLLFTGPALLVTGAGPVTTAILSFAGVTAYKELLTQRSKRKLQRELEKNTSPELVKILMEHPEFLSVPRKMAGTFFFSDVKSFTSISEKMHADVLFPFINRYLDRMTHALMAHQAYVDKYIGDGIMALFGIPVPTPDHARNACKAALDCQAALKPLNAEFALQGLPQIKVRIGIHSGEVSAGNVGALDRSNYTVLGDSVNLAARLEGANKEYDTYIMISEATEALVSGKFVVRELDRIRVVGKRNAVRIFELLAPAGGTLPFDPAFLDAYASALALFKDRLWAESIEGFEKALVLKPGDKPSSTYIERAKVFELMPPPTDWEGVFDLTSK
jgi:adenylate cyclase